MISQMQTAMLILPYVMPIVIALAWLPLFPELATLGRMADLRPATGDGDDTDRVAGVPATAGGVAPT